MSPQEFPELDQDQGPSRSRRTLRADRRNVQAIVIAAVPIVVLLVVIAMGVVLVRGRSDGGSPEATATHLPTTMPTALVAAVRTTVATDTPAPAVNTPTPTLEPTQAQVPTEMPTPSEPTPTPTPSDELVEGAVAVVSDTAGRGLRMRGSPGLNAPTLRVLPEGTEVEIIGGPAEMDGYQWFHILDDANAEGWVAADWLVRIR